ncbi:MAG: hypothetical protein M3256_23960, partial [Actinomycetota bacterium]|nr:hypothetical protein [Actinomycetota bacterium]
MFDTDKVSRPNNLTANNEPSFSLSPTSGPVGTVITMSSGSASCPPPPEAHNPVAAEDFSTLDLQAGEGGGSSPVSPTGTWSIQWKLTSWPAGQYTIGVWCYANANDIRAGIAPYFSYARQQFTVTSAPFQADCYDIEVDGLDSKPAAQYCYDALRTVTSKVQAHTNATADDVVGSNGKDAVFYATGHSASECPGEWRNGTLVDKTKQTGAFILMPGPTGHSTYLVGPHDVGLGDDDCLNSSHPFPPRIPYFWAVPDIIGQAKLVVLQVCDSLTPAVTGPDGQK